MKKKWIKEPTLFDNTRSHDGEHILDWLNRSTSAKAKARREFLNYNLCKLPIEIALELFKDLSSRYHSAFFELILGRLLQEAGFTIQHEVEMNNGKRPDFLIDTQIGNIAIEATSPVFNSLIGNTYKNNNPLIKIIRDHTPKNWIVGIQKLPDIGLSDSKKKYKKFIINEFSKISSNDQKQTIQIHHKFDKGTLILTLLYKESRIDEIGFYPPVSYFDDSISRIEHALNEKRKQLKGIDIPVILAIQGSFTGTDLEDFDQVLFGSTTALTNRERQIIGNKFEANGKFINSDKQSTFQGVLAFDEVGFRKIEIPTLYINTSADNELISLFDCFNIRYYDQKLNEIVNIPAKYIGLLDNFKFVKK